MRLLGWMLLFGVVGCGGDGGSDSGTNTSITGDDDDVITPGGPGDPCADVPQYDPSKMNCDALGTAWDDLMTAAKPCTADGDCAIARPDCANWDAVGCDYAYNHTCVDASTISAFNTRAQTLGCITSTGQVGVCECGSIPEARCVQGTCCGVGVDFICEQ